MINPTLMLLNGRKLKQFMERQQADLRAKYALNRTELEAIVYYALNPGAAAIDLHKTMGLNKGQLSLALERLRAEGYLQAEPDAKDRRLIRWTLLEKGKAIAELARRHKEETEALLLSGLTEEERLTLERISIKIAENIEKLIG